jgi:two-component system OmpR family response regulator
MTTTAPAPVRASRPEDTALRVLVVDDEPAIRELLSLALGYEGWEVQGAADGAAAIAAARTFAPHAVLLDRMLPDMDGVEVLQELRAQAPTLPIVFVTARDARSERLAGLAAGADDYVVKPFSLEDVEARLRRLVRRRDPADDGPAGNRLVVGDLVLDEDLRRVTRGGHRVPLSAAEFDVLRHLMRNAGRVVSRDEVLDWVWHYDASRRPEDAERALAAVRQGVDAGRPPMICTVAGGGYLLAIGEPPPTGGEGRTPSPGDGSAEICCPPAVDPAPPSVSDR